MENFEEQLDLFEDVSKDMLPPETDEKGCDSFDDLVYVPPKKGSQILISLLSEDQEKFLQDNLEFGERYTRKVTDNILWFSSTEMDWRYDYEYVEYSYIGFNDIFIHKDDLEKQ